MADFNPDIGKETRFVAGEQQAEIARRGALASAAVKRDKKILREAALAVIDADPDAPVAIIKKVIQSAKGGSIKAADFLAKLLGEYQDTTVNQQINITPQSPADRYNEVYGRIEDAELLNPDTASNE